MADLFSTMLSEPVNGESSVKNKAQSSDGLEPKSGTKTGNVKVDDAPTVPSGSRKDSREKRSSSKSVSQDSLDRLSEIMSNGFQNLQSIMEQCMVPYDEEEELGCFPSENNFEVDTEEDLFQTISEECQSRDKRGPPVIVSCQAC